MILPRAWSKRRACRLSASRFPTARGNVRVAVHGVRARGDEALVSPDDAWHIGSCTKAITSLLAARMVDAGLITWKTTPGDVFADLPPAANQQNVEAELIQLLSNTSGLSGPATDMLAVTFGRARQATGESTMAQRQSVARSILCIAPIGEAGKQFDYANGGFIVAGAMLEAAADEPLESLFDRFVFEPLGIETAGWGPPSAISGHSRSGEALPETDNPVAYDAAGRLHLSLADWAKLCDVVLGRPDGFLSPESMAALTTPRTDGQPAYALGWISIRTGTLGEIFTHAGTNTAWLAEAVIAPESSAVILVACSQLNRQAVDAARDGAAELLMADRPAE
ncbi:MAG: serine hydrolase domain-containing protein [Planctomycetota bacterium]